MKISPKTALRKVGRGIRRVDATMQRVQRDPRGLARQVLRSSYSRASNRLDRIWNGRSGPIPEGNMFNDPAMNRRSVFRTGLRGYLPQRHQHREVSLLLFNTRPEVLDSNGATPFSEHLRYDARLFLGNETAYGGRMDLRTPWGPAWEVSLDADRVMIHRGNKKPVLLGHVSRTDLVKIDLVNSIVGGEKRGVEVERLRVLVDVNTRVSNTIFRAPPSPEFRDHFPLDIRPKGVKRGFVNVLRVRGSGGLGLSGINFGAEHLRQEDGQNYWVNYKLRHIW